MSHKCLATDCHQVCHSRHFFCHEHWLALPFRLQKKLLALIRLPESEERKATVGEALAHFEHGKQLA